MRTRALLFSGIIMLIILSACSFKNNETISTVTPTPTPERDIIDTKIPEIKIITVYPAHMIVKQSYVISVSLASEIGSSPTLQALEKATMVVTEPTPVGTPGATVGNAFGPAFLPLATATLNAGAFKVLSTPAAEEQLLEQPAVEWDWNVTPQNIGTHILNVDIYFKWELTQSAVIPVEPKFRIGKPQLSVDVITPPEKPVAPTPFFTIGQINLGDLINGGSIIVILSALATFILWILNLRKKKNVAGPTPSPDSLPPNVRRLPIKYSNATAIDEPDDKKTS